MIYELLVRPLNKTTLCKLLINEIEAKQLLLDVSSIERVISNIFSGDSEISGQGDVQFSRIRLFLELAQKEESEVLLALSGTNKPDLTDEQIQVLVRFVSTECSKPEAAESVESKSVVGIAEDWMYERRKSVRSFFVGFDSIPE